MLGGGGNTIKANDNTLGGCIAKHMHARMHKHIHAAKW